MRIRLVQLDKLVEAHCRHNAEEFVEEYPGAFLLAMGFVSAERMMARKRATDERDATASFTFGSRLKHDAAAKHPLAGCAFFVRPTGERTELTVGRSADCDLTVPEPSVSERHCRIEVTADGVQVIDLESTNGTTVNLERLDPHVPKILADEDILTVGRYSFQMMSAQTMYSELELLGALAGG